MKHIEEKDGKIFIDGIEYAPVGNKELPTCYADIIKGSKYENTYGFFINMYGKVIQSGFDVISTKTEGMFTNANFARAMIKLKILLEIRDEYNEGWEPNWLSNKSKWVICPEKDKIRVFAFFNTSKSEFIFKTEELAEQFLKNHKEDIKFIFRHLYMWNN